MVLILLMGMLNLNLVSWITYEIDHARLRQKFEELLLSSTETTQFSEFEFTLNEWSSLERPEPHEFRKDGETYDIASEQISGDVVRIRCICDKLEKEIEAKAERLSKKSQSDEREKSLNWRFTLFPPEVVTESLIFQSELHEHSAMHLCVKLASWSGANFVPPDFFCPTF